MTTRWRRGEAREPEREVTFVADASVELLGLWGSLDRAELVERGLAPRAGAASDGDFLADLIARRGVDAALAIEGAWSALLWFRQERRLLAIGDRQGAEPLYYSSSEPFVIGPDPLDLVAARRLTLDRLGLAGFLLQQAPPPGRTLFRELRVVPPGSTLEVTRERIELRRYWQPGPRPCRSEPGEHEAAQELRCRLEQVVTHYAGEHPGLMLSGGLDSTAVAACLAASRPARNGVAIGWMSPSVAEADESEAITAVAQRTGLRLIPVAADRHLPFHDPLDLEPPVTGPFPTVFSAGWRESLRIARAERLTTLLTGSGGDHLFGTAALPYADLLLRGHISRFLAELSALRARSELRTPALLRRALLAPMLRAYLPRRAYRRRPVLYGVPAHFQHTPELLVPAPPRRMLPGRRDRLVGLLEPSLGWVTQQFAEMARAAGVRLRHPYLDSRLVELALSLPTEQCWRGGRYKAIVREAWRDALPPVVVDQEEKTAPTAILKRALEGGSYAEDLVEDMRLADLGLVDPEAVKRALFEPREGIPLDQALGAILLLEVWLRHHGHRASPPTD